MMLHFENYNMFTIMLLRRTISPQRLSQVNPKSAAVFGASENSSGECVCRFVNGEYVNN